MRTFIQIKWILALCLIPWMISCSSEIPSYSYKAKVDVLLANQSNESCYMWMGHNPLPQATSIAVGCHIDTVLNMKIQVYDITSASEDYTTHQEDWLDYIVQVNILPEGDTTPITQNVEIHEEYSSLYRLKFYWDGRFIHYKYAF